MNATTQLATTDVTAKKFVDWAISSQASLKEVEGSTTRKSSLSFFGNMAKFPRVRVGNSGVWGYNVFVTNCDEDIDMPGFAKKFFVGKEELAKAYGELGTAQSVANRYEVSKKLVLNYMKKYGIDRNSRCSSEERAKQISELAIIGLSSKEISNKLGISQSLVRKTAEKFEISINDPYHRGFITDHAGYRLIKANNHPFSDSKGYVREHRLVIEKSIGRHLFRDEVVHHKDGDKSNNTLDNLELMDAFDHKSHHSKLNPPERAWEARRKTNKFSVSKDIV